MLGDSSLQQWYASADAIQIKPKVIAEWNANSLSQPYIYGHGDGSYLEIETISGATRSTGSLPSSYKFSMSFEKTLSAVSTEYSVSKTIASPSIQKSYKLSFLAKSDKLISLTVLATASTGGTIVDSTTINVELGAISNIPVTLDLFSYNDSDAIDTIQYSFHALNENYNEPVLIEIDAPRIYILSNKESIVSQYFTVADIFKSNRPGDAYLQSGAAEILGNENVSPYHMMWNGSKNGENPRKVRNFLPDEEAAFKYYLYEHSSASETTDTIFAKYTNKSVVNKIVTKINCTRSVPTSMSISTLDSSGIWSTPVSIASPFNNYGLSQIYWNGTTWTKTSWTSIPTYTDQTIEKSIEIYGIKITFTNPVNDTEVHLVEISPRLELDLSSYVKSFSVKQELSNDSVPTPIGISNSDTASIELENLPVQNGSDYIQPFDNYVGPLAGMLKKNVSMRFIVKPFGQDSDKAETQIAKMMTASWNNDGIESCSVELYDALKTLMSLPSPSIYKSGGTVQSIITDILDTVGFSDYNYDALINSTYLKSVIPHYWTVPANDTSVMNVLQNLLLPYQVSMYVDRYGIISFKHIAEILNSAASTTYEIRSTSNNDKSIKSNIVDFNINDENSPSNVSVEYKSVRYSGLTGVTSGSMAPKREKIFSFDNKVIGYVRLASAITKQSRSIEILIDNNAESDNQSFIDSYSGYLLFGSEIIKFDGVEKKFILTSQTSTQIVTRIVKNQAELESILLQYSTMGYIVTQPGETGKQILRNITRGCFGSPISDHPAGVASTSQFISSLSSGAISSSYDNITMNKIASTVAFDASLTNDYKIFSGTFVLPQNPVLPTNGTEAVFGLHLNSTGTSLANSIRVGFRLYKKIKDKTTIVYTAGIIIQQYNSSAVKIKENSFDLISFETNEKGKPVKTLIDKKFVINPAGVNELVVLFSPEASTNTKNMVVMINGNVLSFEGSTKEVELISNAISFKLPCIELESIPNFANKKIAAFTNGVLPVDINRLEASRIIGDNKMNVLSSIMNGNMAGLSNKDELESVMNGRRVSPLIDTIGFKAQAVGREIIVANADFSNNYPVLYCFPVRSAYTFNYPSIGKDNIVYYQTEIIPTDSITFSSIRQTASTAKIALINSYNKPVYMNISSSNELTSAGQETTTLYGSYLVADGGSKVTEILNFDNSDTNISISSDWIQNVSAADSIAKYIAQAASMKKNSISVSVFGNPLLTVGDILNVSHTFKNFSGKYAIVSVSQEFSNGLSTSLTMRRI